MNVGALQTELEIIKSEDLLGRVVDKLGLAANPDLNGTKPPSYMTRCHGSPPQFLVVSARYAGSASPTLRAWARAENKAREADPHRRAAIGTISSRLSATLVGRTFIILISVESPNGDLSAQVANAIADMYLVDQLDAKYEANKRATGWLDERLANSAVHCRPPTIKLPLIATTRGCSAAPREPFPRRRSAN